MKINQSESKYQKQVKKLIFKQNIEIKKL